MEDDHEKEDTEYVKFDDERERFCRMVFKENYGWVDNKKALLHDKRWGVYVKEKENIIKGGYFL